MVEGVPEENFGKQGFDISGGKLRPLALLLFFLGLFVLAVGGGLFFFKNQNTSDSDIQIIATAENAEKTEGTEIVVHVDGAVVKPGVYNVPIGSRVTDVIEVAGGLTDDADGAKVNLAAKVSDGQKIYVPSTIQNSKFKVQNGGSVDGTTLISINSASQAELEGLPGVGPVTAQKIIALRPYSLLEELLSRKAVNKSVWEKIKDLVTY